MENEEQVFHDIDKVIKEAREVISKAVDGEESRDDDVHIDNVISEVEGFLEKEYPSLPIDVHAFERGEDSKDIMFLSKNRLN
jgi:hypothetical protein